MIIYFNRLCFLKASEEISQNFQIQKVDFTTEQPFNGLTIHDQMVYSFKYLEYKIFFQMTSEKHMCYWIYNDTNNAFIQHTDIFKIGENKNQILSKIEEAYNNKKTIITLDPQHIKILKDQRITYIPYQPSCWISGIICLVILSYIIYLIFFNKNTKSKLIKQFEALSQKCDSL